MPLDLHKGEKITAESLRKSNKGEALQKVRLGLSWTMKPGLDADLDASVVLLGNDGMMWAEDSIVFYHKLESNDGAIKHTGDVREGGSEDQEGDNDDENIIIDLSKVSVSTQAILAVITSYPDDDRPNEPIRFGSVKNATVKLYSEDSNGSHLLCSFDLTEDISAYTAMEMAKLTRDGDSWSFEAIGRGVGEGRTPNGLEDVLKKYSRWF